jgi:hypothetical protein
MDHMNTHIFQTVCLNGQEGFLLATATLQSQQPRGITLGWLNLRYSLDGREGFLLMAKRDSSLPLRLYSDCQLWARRFLPLLAGCPFTVAMETTLPMAIGKLM